MNKFFSKILSVGAPIVEKMRQRSSLYVDLISDECIETVLFYVGVAGDRISILRRRDRYILRIMAFEDSKATYIEKADVIRIYSYLEKSIEYIDSSIEDFSCVVFEGMGSEFEMFVHRVGCNIFLSKHNLSKRFRIYTDRRAISDAVSALRVSGFI